VGTQVVSEQVEIRAAGARDLEAIVSLAVTCARSHHGWAGSDWSPPAVVAENRLWWARLRDERTFVAVAQSGATMVGAVSAWPAAAEHLRGVRTPQVAYVAGPFVDPEWWGEGIGAALHNELLAVLARLHYLRAELAVEAGNRRARRFLERNGWQRLEGGPRRSAMALLTYARAIAG
jgi:GNAT superfamily N-acetyltransferase